MVYQIEHLSVVTYPAFRIWILRLFREHAGEEDADLGIGFSQVLELIDVAVKLKEM